MANGAAPTCRCTTSSQCAGTPGCCAPLTDASGNPIGPNVCKPNDGAAYDCCNGAQTCSGSNCCATDAQGNNVCVAPCQNDTQCGAAQHFDRVVVAVDPHAALKVLDATDEERAVFSQVQHMPYATFAARVEGFADGQAEVGYLKENMSADRQGRPMAWIKRYPDDNVFVFHLFAPPSISDAEVVANIQEDMHKLGAGRVMLLDSRRWAFFPHVSSDAMRVGHFFERAANLQGRNRTVFVNEALGMSTMADSADLGRKTAQRLAAGEY